MPQDKFEEIENDDLQTPGVEPENRDEDDQDDELDGMDEPDTVGARHGDADAESGKGGQVKVDDGERIDPRVDPRSDQHIDQDSDPSE